MQLVKAFNSWHNFTDITKSTEVQYSVDLKAEMLTLLKLDFNRLVTQICVCLCCSGMNPDRVSLCVKHPYLHALATSENNPHFLCRVRNLMLLFVSL